MTKKEGLRIRTTFSEGNMHGKKRYDGAYMLNFDNEQRVRPGDDDFKKIDFYAKKQLIGPDLVPNNLAGAVLADQALKTRGLVGVVLGSSGNRFFNPTDDLNGIDKASDVDVLILNSHSEKNPAPHEWGVDWWVKPQFSDKRFATWGDKLLPPTNGSINLSYNLSLASDFEFGGKASNDSSLEIDTEKNEVVDLQKRFRGKILDKVVKPGLYLLEKETMDRIADHVQQLEIRQFAHHKWRAFNICHEILNRRYFFTSLYPEFEDLSSDGKYSLVAAHALLDMHKKYEEARAILKRLQIDIQYPSISDVCLEMNQRERIDFLLVDYKGTIESQLYQPLNRLAKIRDYSYLRYGSEESENGSLFPVLPDSAIKFSPLYKKLYD